jgi:hypothetical protein
VSPECHIYRVRQRGENEPLLLSQISSAATSGDHARGIGREPTVGGHEAMVAFHARAEGTLPNRCSPPLFDDEEGVGMTGFHKANSGPAPSRFPTDVTDEMKLVK